jgi:hypothetical protein
MKRNFSKKLISILRNPNEVIDLSPDLKSTTTKEQKIIKSKYSIIYRMNIYLFCFSHRRRITVNYKRTGDSCFSTKS